MNILLKWQCHYCLIVLIFIKIRICESDPSHTVIQTFQSSTSDINNIVHNVEFYYTSDEEIIEIHIESNKTESNLTSEILLVLRYEANVELWRVQTSQNATGSTVINATKSLCLAKSSNQKNIEITVLKNVNVLSYTLKVQKHRRYTLTSSGSLLSGIHVTRKQPARVRLKLDSSANFSAGSSYQLEVKNQSLATCALVSVISTSHSCPDNAVSTGQAANVKFSMRQSMLEQTAILLPKGFEHGNVFVIVSLKATQEGCTFNKSELFEGSVFDELTVDLVVKERTDSVLLSVLVVCAIYTTMIGTLLCLYCFCARGLDLEGVYGAYDNEVRRNRNRSVFQKIRRFARKEIIIPVSQTEDTCTGGGRCRQQQLQQQQQLHIINRQRDSHIPTDNQELQQPIANGQSNEQQPQLSKHSIQEESSCCCRVTSTTRQMSDAIDTIVNSTVNLALDTVSVDGGTGTGSIDFIDKSIDDDDRDYTEDVLERGNSVDGVRVQIPSHLAQMTRQDSVDGEDVFPLRRNREELRRRRIEENNLGSVAENYYRRAKEENKADRHERDNSYFWLTGLMGMFYLLPVLQLVLNHQQVYQDSGNQDVCYFNFKCMSRFWIFEDFGHVFSNFSYLMSGILFIILVHRRHSKYQKLCTNWHEPYHPENCGIPDQYGMHYALGLALIMEGLLSACYHICPTTKNFQFDTTFMYVIGLLIFLKVYQFRHPDITQKARKIFLILGAALTVEVIGYYTADTIFWIFFVILDLMIVVYFIVQNHTKRYLTELGPSIKALRNCTFASIFKDAKFYSHSLLVILLNITLCIVILWLRKPGVSRYILMIIMANMMLYVVYYVCMKLYYRFFRTKCVNEGLRKTTCVYLILSLAFAAIAVYYFKTERKKGSYSPAESRNLNDYCEMGIFDTHDLWHFCSSSGLLFMFMFILTLEDNNVAVKRKNIPVF